MPGVKTRVQIRKNPSASEALQHATEKQLLDVGQAGFNASQEVILEEATDTGQLERSGFAPRLQSDGTVTYGWSADYAAAVDQGSVPHWPPIKPLLGWVRRVFGVSGSRKWAAAKGVQQMIAEEGTDPVDFVEAGIQAARATAEQRGLDELLEERL